MSNLAKKTRDENDKKVLQQAFGRKPKHRCPICHRFSLWLPSKKHKGEIECVMCEMIRMTKEEGVDEGSLNIKPANLGK